MKKGLLLLIAFIAFTGIYAQVGWKAHEMEVKILLKSQNDAVTLQRLGIETEAASPDGSTINGYIVPSELNLLKASGLTFSISIPDLNEHYKRFWEKTVPPGYKTYEEIVALADSLATAFPSICKKVVYGTSYGGRELAALKISDNVNVDEPEPEIMFDAGIHGDEVLNPDILIRFARDLCTGYTSNPSYTDFINTREIWLYYMVNPDGRVMMTRDNQNNVDCNRDFGYMWDVSVSSPGPFSQNETKALRTCMLDNQFVVYTNYHGGTEIIAYPWSYRSTSTLDLPHIDQLASRYAATSGYFSLQYGQGFNLMYAINGSTKDFSYGCLGDVGWSIETSMDKQPDYSTFMYYYNSNLPAMLEMIRRAGYGVEGMVTDSVTGLPVRALVWVDNFYPVCSDPVVGDYHKYVLPGTHSLRITANGYQTKTITGITVPNSGSVMRDIQLSPDPKYYGYRVISCQIPGTNTGDEGYTPGALGSPDITAYSLGKAGWIVIDMGDTLFNGPGYDLKVNEAPGTAEGFSCFCSTSRDGPWILLGSGMGTTSFDLSLVSGGPVSKARYVKILDDGDGQEIGNDAGFDLDALELLTLPLMPSFTADNDHPCNGTPVSFTDHSKGNPNTWSWVFEGGTPAISTLQNPGPVYYAIPGIYNVSLTISNGLSSATTLMQGYIHVLPQPIVYLGNDTLVSSATLLNLDAGNTGSIYHWSTGATTQTITVDSSGTGNGTVVVFVTVTDTAGCAGSDTIRITFSGSIGLANLDKTPDLFVYPNPNRGQFQLNARGFLNGQLEILNLYGESIFTKKLAAENRDVYIDLGTLPSGLYILKVNGNQRMEIRKIIIEK